MKLVVSRQFLMLFFFNCYGFFIICVSQMFFVFFVLSTLVGSYFWQFSIKSYETFSECQHNIYLQSKFFINTICPIFTT